MSDLPRSKGMVWDGMQGDSASPPNPEQQDDIASKIVTHLESVSGGVVMLTGFLGWAQNELTKHAVNEATIDGFKQGVAAALRSMSNANSQTNNVNPQLSEAARADVQ